MTDEEKKIAKTRKELEIAEEIIKNDTLKSELKHKELVEESMEVGIM